MNEISLSELLPDEGITELVNAINEAPDNGLHQAIVGVLVKYKDALLAKGVDYNYLAYAIEAKMTSPPKDPAYKPGMRVRVFDGSGQNFLGEGVYEGTVKVHYIIMPDRSLRSLGNAEEEPPADMIPEGAHVGYSDNNPKLRLDNGQVVYGCQTWWEPI